MVVVDSYSEANQDQGGSIRVVHPSAVASKSARSQSFTVSSRAILTTMQFYMVKTGAPIGNMRARLYAHSGVYGTSSIPTGAVLDESSSVTMASLGGAFALFTFTFSGGYIMNAGQYVAMVYANDATVLDTTTNYISGGGMDGSVPTHGGNEGQYSNSVWTGENAYDLCFYVNGTLAPLKSYPSIEPQAVAVGII